MTMRVLKRAGALLPVLFTTLLFVSQPAGATTIEWIGCGISKLGFMQDLAAAYERKSGVKIALEGGALPRGSVRSPPDRATSAAVAACRWWSRTVMAVTASSHPSTG